MTRLPRLAALAATLAALAAASEGPAPRLDAWRILGPGGGGTFYRPTVSPHDPNLVVQTTDMQRGALAHRGPRAVVEARLPVSGAEHRPPRLERPR